MRYMRRLVLASVVATVALCGCRAPGPLPAPLPQDRVTAATRAWANSIRTVRDRDVSLQITQTVEGRRRELPGFGGQMGFDRTIPALYLLAEKLGQTAFWLRARGDRFWLAFPRTSEVATGGPAAYAKLPHLIRPQEVRTWFAGPERVGLTWPATEMSVGPECYRFDVFLAGALLRSVFVDRRKLVIEAIQSFDALGRRVTEVHLEDYAPLDGIQFPRAIAVERPLEGMTVRLELGGPELNPDINPAAFLPGRRPGWTHVDLDRRPLSALRALQGD